MNDCLPEPALWPAATGDHVPPDVVSHLQSCARCSAHVTRLRDHRRQLSAATAYIDQPSQPPEESPTRTRSVCFNSHTALPDADDRASSHLPEVTDSPAPARIGPYPIERLLRLGGQAEVYLARHPTLGINVVVKWAYASLSVEPHIADRFTEEARLLAAIRHRHLPRVFDLGIESDRPYLVLEHLAGGSLATPRDEPLKVRDAVILIAKVARVLHAVHEFGRLHLDIQPDNILVGHDGEPRLIDFGMSLSRTARPELRRHASLHGTPEYMAPEQLAGDADRIGVATDLYALGAVLHELLTGVAPQPELFWQGEVAERAAPTALVRNALPTALARSLRRALHPDPRRRYGSASEFARDLESVAAGSRRPTALLAGVLICCGVGVGTVRLGDLPIVGPRPNNATMTQLPRRALIAGAVNRLFRDPSAGDRPASIILADGRIVPVSTEPRASSAATEQFAGSIAQVLANQPGTTLLLIADDRSRSHSTNEIRRLLRSPQLPAGTIAHITDDNVSIVAAVGRSTRSGLALTTSLNRLQSVLRRQTSGFSALVLSSAPQPPIATPSKGAPARLSEL